MVSVSTLVCRWADIFLFSRAIKGIFHPMATTGRHGVDGVGLSVSCGLHDDRCDRRRALESPSTSRTFSFWPTSRARCATNAPRRSGGSTRPPASATHPAPRVRCSRHGHPTGGFPLRLSPAVCLVWMVSVHLISVVSTAIHARGSAREIARKTLTGVCVSVRLAVVACREVPGYLDSKLFPASAWAPCFYKPKPSKN